MRVKTTLTATVAAACLAVAVTWAAISIGGPAGAATAAGPTAPGGTWGDPQPVPGVAALAPSGGSLIGSIINGLSCASPGNCAAVGDFDASEATGVAQWPFVVTDTDGAWGNAQQVAGVTSLGAEKTAVLLLASCGAAGDCAASGLYQGTNGAMHAFIVTESGGTWGTATALSEAGLGASLRTEINGMSCPAAGECAAIGTYAPATNPDSISAFVIDESNGTWGAPQPVPGLASLQSANSESYLASVSCAGPGDCTAAGGYDYQSSTGRPFVVSESGHTWGNAQEVLGSGSAELDGGQLTSVSCPDASDCTAVGFYRPSGMSFNQAFTAGEVSGSWGQAQPLTVPTAAAMTTGSVDCWSAGDCTVIGAFNALASPTTLGPDNAFTASETSGTWGTGQPIPGLPASQDVYATALSCAPAGDCTVVGFYMANPDGAPRHEFIATSSAGGSLQAAQSMPSAYDADGPQVVGPDCTQSGYCTLAVDTGPSPLLASEASADTVALTAPPATYGREQSVKLVATVSAASGGTPTGTVTVTAPDGSTLCRITLSAGTGSCALAAKSLPGGTQTLTASYSGDASYAATHSTTTVTIAGAATVTSLATFPVSMTFTGKITTVKFSVGVTSTAGTPTGFQTVQNHGLNLANCGGSLTAGKVACSSPVGILAPGRYGYVDRYLGDTDFAPSTSAVRYLTVAKARTVTALTLTKTTIAYGHESAERLTVSVSHVGSVYVTGTVAVKIGSTTLCTISLRKGTGSCTLSSKRLKPGTYHLTASYPGNADYLRSASSSKTLKVVS